MIVCIVMRRKIVAKGLKDKVNSVLDDMIKSIKKNTNDQERLKRLENIKKYINEKES